MRRLALLVVLVVAACADTRRNRRRRNIAIPDRLLGYTYAGGTIRPIPNTQTGIVRGSSLQSAY